MTADQRPAARNGLGRVTFVIALLGALLAVIPPTAAFGALLCLVAIIPAIVSFRRVRKGSATNRRGSVAALVLAPVFFIVAISIGAATSPSLTTGSHGGTPPLAGTPALQSPAVIVSPRVPAAPPARAPAAPASTRGASPAVAKAPAAAPARSPA
ncbi:MAG: hypothetical protein ACRDQI_03310, partial [Pseudonocardiaceae bacterium]